MFIIIKIKPKIDCFKIKKRLKVEFDDVLAESEGAHSMDW
jgi:hypothetical protein